MPILHIDIETFSECDISSAGGYRYSEHPTTELLCACYRFDDGPVHLWVPHPSLPEELLRALDARITEKFGGRPEGRGQVHVQRTAPSDVQNHVARGLPVAAYGANFERTQLNGVAGRKVGFPKLSIAQMQCTQFRAAVYGVERNLSGAARGLGTYPKDDAGRSEMLQLAKPRTGKIRRYTPDNSPDKFVRLYLYCMDDVMAECGVDDALPPLTPWHDRYYSLDQRKNDRGWAVDMKMVGHIQVLIRKYKLKLEETFTDLTACDAYPFGVRPTQREKVADWCRSNGYPELADMKAETVKALIKGERCPKNVKDVLRIYSTFGMKAVSKYAAMEESVCLDGRLHGMFLPYGAGTGRWSSVIVQLQNLFRPVIDDPDLALRIFETEDLEWLQTVYWDTDPMRVMASCIRRVLRAAPGKELIYPDFAGVESRLCAWVWGEDWKLEAFRKYDMGKGPGSYEVVYAQMFNVIAEEITKKDPRRQQGKVFDLSFQYEGGVPALIKMVDTYGLKLDELADALYPLLPPEILDSAQWMWEKFGAESGLKQRTYMALDGAKQIWRARHPRIKRGWKEMREACALAIEYPGKIYAVAGGKIKFRVETYKGNTWLYMKLPSGRKLAYFKPMLEWPKKRHRAPDGSIRYVEDKSDASKAEVRYWGVDTETRRYMLCHTYGGKLNENGIQAIGVDKLFGALLRLEERGYIPIGSIHDEPITEVEKGYGSDEEVTQLMCATEEWDEGLPVAVELHRDERYWK